MSNFLFLYDRNILCKTCITALWNMNWFSSVFLLFTLISFPLNSYPLIASLSSLMTVFPYLTSSFLTLSCSSCRARRACWTLWWRTPCSPPGRRPSWAANHEGATSPVLEDSPPPLPPRPRRSSRQRPPPPPAAPPLLRASGRAWQRKSLAMWAGKGTGPGAPPKACTTTTFITTRPGALTCRGSRRHSRQSPKWIPVTSRRTAAPGTASTRGMALHQGLDPFSPQAHLHLRPPALGSQFPTRGCSSVAGLRGSVCPARVNQEGGASAEAWWRGWSPWTCLSRERTHPCWTLPRLTGTSLTVSRAIRTRAPADANSACRSCILGTRTCWEGACWHPKELRLKPTHTNSYPSRVPAG